MKDRNALFVSLGLVSGLAVSGCGGNPADSFLSSLAQSSCDWEFHCCTDPEIKQLDKTKFTDAKSCVPFRLLDVRDQLAAERFEVNAGRVRVDSDKSAACLAAVAMRACNQADGRQATTNMMGIDPCTKVFVGTVAAGGECELSMDCAPGTRCVTSGIHGVCVALQKVGEICNTSIDCDQSAQSVYCSQSDFHCHVRAPIGGACAYTMTLGVAMLPLVIECDQTSNVTYCDPISNTCKKYPQDGESCLGAKVPGVFAQCDPTQALRLTCDNTLGMNLGTCRGPGKLGSDCTRIACDPLLDLYCSHADATTCVALPSAGASCAATGKCKAPSYCNFGSQLCAAPATAGQSCSGGVNCDTDLYCDFNGSTCVSKLPDGAACVQPVQCKSSSCAFGGASPTCQPRQGPAICAGR